MNVFLRALCVAAVCTGICSLSQNAFGQEVKSAKACNNELRANREHIQAAGMSVRDFNTCMLEFSPRQTDAPCDKAPRTTSTRS